MSKTQITMLNSMAGGDFEAALDMHVEWGMWLLDLKDRILGKKLMDLTNEEATEAAEAIAARELSVQCLSSGLFHDEVENGEVVFREEHLGAVSRLIELARIFQPRLVRLLAAKTSRRNEMGDCMDYICTQYPWLVPRYGEAVDRIHDAGFSATIENEVRGCILSTPDEVAAFFEQLGRREKVCLTWDVQNLWQMGTFPSLEAYERLKPWLGYFHLKGGRAEGDGQEMRWASSLEDASWPVLEITGAVIRDGVSPVLCLNPSHGERPEGYDATSVWQHDLTFLRNAFPEVE